MFLDILTPVLRFNRLELPARYGTWIFTIWVHLYLSNWAIITFLRASVPTGIVNYGLQGWILIDKFLRVKLRDITVLGADLLIHFLLALILLNRSCFHLKVRPFLQLIRGLGVLHILVCCHGELRTDCIMYDRGRLEWGRPGLIKLLGARDGEVVVDREDLVLQVHLTNGLWLQFMIELSEDQPASFLFLPLIYLYCNSLVFIWIAAMGSWLLLNFLL